MTSGPVQTVHMNFLLLQHPVSNSTSLHEGIKEKLMAVKAISYGLHPECPGLKETKDAGKKYNK